MQGSIPTLVAVFGAAFVVVVGVWVVTRLVKLVWMWAKYAAALTAASLGLCELQADHGAATCLDAFIDALPMTNPTPPTQTGFTDNTIDHATRTVQETTSNGDPAAYSDWLTELVAELVGGMVHDLPVLVNSITVTAFLSHLVIGAVLVWFAYVLMEASIRAAAIGIPVLVTAVLAADLWVAHVLMTEVLVATDQLWESLLVTAGIGTALGALVIGLAFKPELESTAEPSAKYSD